MTVTDTTETPDKTFWACGRAMGGYPGSFPNGFLARVEEQFGCYYDNVLFPFGGAMPHQFEERDGDIGTNWVVNDIEPDLGMTTFDATDLPDNWEGEFDRVICDPPYGDYSQEIYEKDHPGYKNIYMEALKCVKPGGYLMILDFLVYVDYANAKNVDTDMQTERQQPIAVTTGPNMRIRVLNVFKRVE